LLRLIDGDTACVGKVYYKMYSLKHSMLQVAGLNARQKAQITRDLEARWTGLLHSDIHSAGYCLDPEYMAREYGQDDNEEVMEGFRRMCVRIVGEDRADECLEQWTKYNNREGTFANRSIEGSAMRLPAWKFWQINGASVPLLKKVVSSDLTD
jgi:hypothetical protein